MNLLAILLFFSVCLYGEESNDPEPGPKLGAGWETELESADADLLKEVRDLFVVADNALLNAPGLGDRSKTNAPKSKRLTKRQENDSKPKEKEAKEDKMDKEDKEGDFADKKPPSPQEYLALAGRCLRVVAEKLKEQHAAWTDWEAKKRSIKAFHTAFPLRRNFYLLPEVKFPLPPEAPPCPPLNQDYAHFAELKDDYWQDPVYLKLGKLPQEELPDGAMLALCELVHVPVDSRVFESPEGKPLKILMKSYGPRLYPAFLAHLAVGSDKILGQGRGALRFCEVARDWPAEQRVNFYRAILRAGWNASIGRWPSEEWAKKLKEEFADSPYGPP